ncbi:hydrogenase nickel incorporation protein HypB [Mycolicibacterium gilvum]|uniref:Hydrogenase nickel incorporation protein HypB n=1 Tax=Mycolicibacterium gilvum TaxID=1804 RepID=A0A378SLQ9_9MYCO|nr:hydrogenase nickel incorporation protein HypB [Mycolicibacterium gilvum]MCV7059133.1 hydrogenase nickel incorporation protein HypB [Mycolicibacterium gilvum]STZ43058.1 hydrogenase nickel incorporation protein HypB [Mycolicibacterium gilvum]
MCATCGCGENGTTITVPVQGHDHHHNHPHDQPDDHHQHHHPHPTETVTLEQKVLAKNDGIAARNRRWLTERDIVAFNMTSSPGSGKTTLLERTIRDLHPTRSVAVIEGDQETLLDAERIQATGARVVQVNTGAGCHLDAEMIRRALDTLAPRRASVLFIENVGNLVCPALFDLGETSKVVVISATEGADKPLKYPHMFAAADLVLINKSDLLPYVDFDIDACASAARSVNPGVGILTLSAKTGDGVEEWYDWISQRSIYDARVPIAGGRPAPEVRPHQEIRRR